MPQDTTTRHLPVQVELPADVRSAIALSNDTDSAGIRPDGICHGRTMPALQQYMLRLCETAEQYGVQMHFFQIGNGFEVPAVIEYLREILDRGHVIDTHTYTHVPPISEDTAKLDKELALTNRLFEEHLHWTSIVLLGPGGYTHGLDGLLAHQEVILNSGFRWVSGRYNHDLHNQGQQFALEASVREPVYAYPTGLIVMPVQGYTDRAWFDMSQRADVDTCAAWRQEHGHQPVPPGWRCPWTSPNALDEWIEYDLAAADFAYENRLLWIPVWHPYSHYLHDPDNRMLPTLLEHCAGKPEKVWMLTVRDAARVLVSEGTAAC